jgi:peroxin-1
MACWPAPRNFDQTILTTHIGLNFDTDITETAMRKVKVKYSTLHSSLVNLPLSVYGPLVSTGVVSSHLVFHIFYKLTFSKRPQAVAVHLSNSKKDKDLRTAYVGWTGLASSPSSGTWKAEDTLESIEIDPQLCTSLGFTEGEVVSYALGLEAVAVLNPRQLELGLVHNLPVASSVSTEPISSDDWEILVSSCRVS